MHVDIEHMDYIIIAMIWACNDWCLYPILALAGLDVWYILKIIGYMHDQNLTMCFYPI